MDWVFKSSSSWELTEVERDEFDVLVMEKNQNMEDFCVDSGILEDWGLNEQKHSTESYSLSPPSKKPREQLVSCLVDGCTDDLSSCRDYHRRHRVCEAHSKTPVVVIGGKHQRFCQQCSRFHSVGEFDDVKRSCRKRLDGHNRRRRKPRGPESSVYLNGYNYGSFFTNHQGAKLLRFGGSQAAYTSSPLRWPDREKLPVSKITRATEIKFPFLLGSESDEQVPGHTAAAHHLVGTQLVDPNTTAVLSLLSKHTNTIHHNNTSQPTMPTSFNLPSNNHLIGMIHFRTQGFSLENQAPQLLSFSYNPN